LRVLRGLDVEGSSKPSQHVPEQKNKQTINSINIYEITLY